MELKEFNEKLKDKKLSNKTTKEIANKVYEYATKNNLNLNNSITLLAKIDNLITTLDKAEFKTDSQGFVKTKNFPKLIETFFELLNEGNIYYLEQTKINEVVKYLNHKLSPLVPNSYFDKKILKRIFYNIDSSKVEFTHYYELENNSLNYVIKFNIVTNNEDKKSETFDVIFNKKIMFDDDFESSKWNFSLWTLNDVVDELKACVKWMKTNNIK